MNILNKAVSKQQLLLRSTLRFFTASTQQYQNIIVEKKEGGVGFVQLNRTKSLNALCDALFIELHDAL